MAFPISIVRPSTTSMNSQMSAIPAHFTYRGGALLSSVQLFTIFWGREWQSDSSYTYLLQNLNTFFQTIVSSPLIDQLSEYSQPNFPIGRGNFVGTATLNEGFPIPHLFAKTILFDIMIQKRLQQAISQGIVPKPTANMLYFFFFPAGVIISKQGEFSCRNFCGYHNAISSDTFYGVLPYPSCSGCSGGMLPFDSLTTTSSHELCEAITDAVPGQGWYDATYGEIGDVCAWKTKQLGQYTIQREWSQANIACV